MFKIVEAYTETGDFGTFEKYPEATKARDAISKSTGKFFTVIDLNAVVAEKAPVDQMWINKDLPKTNWDAMITSANRASVSPTQDEPEGYMGE